jgi:hypothetical protein
MQPGEQLSTSIASQPPVEAGTRDSENPAQPLDAEGATLILDARARVKELELAAREVLIRYAVGLSRADEVGVRLAPTESASMALLSGVDEATALALLQPIDHIRAGRLEEVRFTERSAQGHGAQGCAVIKLSAQYTADQGSRPR